MSQEQDHQFKFVYGPGQVCHTGFHGTDFAAAKRVFTEGLGWTAFDVPESPSPYAVLIDANEHGFGGVGVTGVGFEDPATLVYVNVPDLEKAKAAIGENGGTLLGGEIEVPGRGRFVMFRSPGGIFAAAWVNTIDVPDGLPVYKHERLPGTIVGRPMASADPAADAKFFEIIFGWSSEPRESPTGATVYMWNDNGGDGGVFYPASDDDEVGPVQIHVLVADIDAATAQVKSAGGVLIGQKQSFGDFAFRQDVRIPGAKTVTLWQDRN